MIFLSVRIDNFYCFQDTSIDFTYPRRLVNSSLEDEFLPERPNFRFKRVCILAGGNASGKTAFGRVLCAVQNMLTASPAPSLKKAFSNKKKKALIGIDFVTENDLRLHRFAMVFNPQGLEMEVYGSVPIGKNDSYEITSEKLDRVHTGKIRGGVYHENTTPTSSFASVLAIEKKIDVQVNWHYVFNGDHQRTGTHTPKDKSLLEAVLRTFDQSIEKVSNLGKGDLRITFSNEDSVVIDKDGNITNKDRLSLGTFEAIGTAFFLESVINSQAHSMTFYLDESMAYAHSELERTVINLLISKLNTQSQLFITTHNCEVLDMNLPIHSYLFLRKEKNRSEFIKPELSFKKNDRSLINYLQNDVFQTMPDTSALDDLL